jgi:CubicO group peptidase (beta-lactamase class C family)
VEKGIIPNADTVYPVASCTKAFTAALCGILVEEGKLSWTEPVKTYLPDFDTVHDPEIGKRATLLDLCSHGTGLAPLDHAFLGFHDEFWTPLKDQVRVAGNLPVCYDFRTQWLYNNTMIGVVGDIIAAVTGEPWPLVLRKKILEPLGLTRSFTGGEDYPPDGNFARGYSVRDDGSLLPLEQSAINSGDFHESAGSLKSTVSDMLMWAKAMMEAEAQEGAINITRPNDISAISPNPLRQTKMVTACHRPLCPGGGVYDDSYGLCWFRHMLPSQSLSFIGANGPLLQDPPVMNKDGPPRLTIMHSGEFNGFLTAFYTFPETCSAVVAIANCSPGWGDPSDLAAQHLVQELFQMTPRIDYTVYSMMAVKNAGLVWPAVVEEWTLSRHANTKSGLPDEYVGAYVNEDLRLTIEVYNLESDEVGCGENPELLGFTVNGLKRQSAKLRHYHYDTWTFLPESRDDALHKGMESFMKLSLVLLSFTRNEQGLIAGVEWDLHGGPTGDSEPGSMNNVRPVHLHRR